MGATSKPAKGWLKYGIAIPIALAMAFTAYSVVTRPAVKPAPVAVVQTCHKSVTTTVTQPDGTATTTTEQLQVDCSGKSEEEPAISLAKVVGLKLLLHVLF